MEKSSQLKGHKLVGVLEVDLAVQTLFGVFLPVNLEAQYRYVGWGVKTLPDNWTNIRVSTAEGAPWHTKPVCVCVCGGGECLC